MENYIQDAEGTTAIELAFVAAPLVYFLLGIIEVALMFTTSIVLEGATSDASRLIRTGQAQQSGNAQAMFEDALCDAVSVLANCNDIEYEVITIDGGFGGAGANNAQFNPDGSFDSQGFDAGGVSDVVLIRAVYQYALKTPIMSEFFSDPGSDTRLMMSTIVLQTEPYDFDD
jgi:Flp pilus assembly protein TadG|tara:strand:+ start:60093 stop:60608 length:516 start_codon:yes stop_codon:yes gene_type:complete